MANFTGQTGVTGWTKKQREASGNLQRIITEALEKNDCENLTDIVYMLVEEAKNKNLAATEQLLNRYAGKVATNLEVSGDMEQRIILVQDSQRLLKELQVIENNVIDVELIEEDKNAVG